MPGRSDSDSSPDSPSSSDSSSSGEEVRPITDPGSPSHAQQSSDESSSSSDGVLVELPGPPDQDSRGLPVDPDSGILVDIDESLQESADESGREETFEDASEDLESVRSLSVGLEESIAMIDIGESSGGRLIDDDLARLQARLDDTTAECWKHKEESEVFRKEVLSLRQNIHDIFDCLLATAKNDDFANLSQLRGIGNEDSELSSPLHTVLNDCSKFLVDLKSNLRRKIDSESKIRDLHDALSEKDQEIKNLNAKYLETCMSHDVVLSYLGSLKETWSKFVEESTNHVTSSLLPSLDSVIGREHVPTDYSPIDDLSLVEKKTLVLIKKHTEFLSQIHLLQQCLEEVSPAFAALEDNKLGNVFSYTRNELLESKRRDAYLLEKIDRLEEENKKLAEQAENTNESLAAAHTEINKTKLELEQTENKFMAAKERLGIAVTKGKSLVQYRDSLKQALIEKTGELEKCMQELQQKSGALQSAEANLEELNLLLQERTSELEKCLEELQHKTDDLETAKASIEDLNAKYALVISLQESLSQRDKCLKKIEEVTSIADFPEEVLSMEVIDRIIWFINQKKISDVILLENRKIRDAISSIELPQDVFHRELDYLINWVVTQFMHAKDDISKLQDEINGARAAMASQESEISEARKGIDQLESYLLEEKLAKETLHNELEELKCQYEDTVENLSMLSSDKAHLMKVLLELSECTLDELPVDTSSIVEKCMIKINVKMKSSHIGIEQLERMQSTIYLTDQELKLCEKILEDEMTDRSAMEKLSNELTKLSNEAFTLKNEKDSIHKELERAEERNSLLREKLSMAVKKGKGLVQEREGFKLYLEEKTFEIEKLKHELQLKDTTIIQNQQQIHNLLANIQHNEKLEANIITVKVERDQIQQSLQETNTKLENLVTSIEKIVLPTLNVFEGPSEKIDWIAEYIEQSEVAKFHAREELDNIKEESSLQARRLSDTFATIKTLEDELSKTKEHISFLSEEKQLIQLGKVYMEQELEKLKEENALNASKLSEAYAIIRSLEDALEKSKEDFCQLNTDRNQLENEHEHEILELKTKLAECREELARTNGSFENYLTDLNSHIGDFVIFIKDDGLFSMMTERFRNKIDGLRKMNSIVQNMHDHFASKGLQIHPGKENPTFGKIPALPKFEDLTNNWGIQFEAGATDVHPSLTSITGGLRARDQLLGNYFEVFYNYLEEHTASILQSLQVTSDELVHALQLSESLKLDVKTLVAQKEAQEAKILSMENKMVALLTACNVATRELTELCDLEKPVSSLQKAEFSCRTEEDAVPSVNGADNLLHVAKITKNQFKQLLNTEKVWLTSMDVMKNKLEEAELIAKTAIEERTVNQEKVSKLENNIEALKVLCTDLKNEVENYQAKEAMLKNKEEELLSMQHSLDSGISSQELSESQMNALIDKVNKLEVSFFESGTPDSEVHFTGTVEKLFYIVDKVIDMQRKLDMLTYEKEVMQLIQASHLREIERLKVVSQANTTNFQELELKKKELLETSGDLERIITKLGGYDLLQDQKKPYTTKLLVTVLERLTTATYLECENLKSRAQELGVKLHAKDNLIRELSEKVKIRESSTHSRSVQQEVTKERTVSESAPIIMDSGISEIEDAGPPGKNTMSPGSTAAQLRTTRKGSNEHLALNIDSGTDRSLLAQETDAKGHLFKSLNTSGLIPKQGKLIADKLDGIWVSGGQLLMRRPGARLVLIAYMFFLHLWFIGAVV